MLFYCTQFLILRFSYSYHFPKLEFVLLNTLPYTRSISLQDFFISCTSANPKLLTYLFILFFKPANSHLFAKLLPSKSSIPLVVSSLITSAFFSYGMHMGTFVRALHDKPCRHHSRHVLGISAFCRDKLYFS